MSNENKFAILIDGDNISPSYIKTIFDEISMKGTATYKRIYGDWTSPSLAGWKSILLDYSITPMQQYGYTAGKNATDSAMIIDAMDILYAGKVNGFCLATSDSDFTKLASRLRESGMTVVGMGEEKTPRSFVAACDEFKFLDKIAHREEKAAAAAQKQKAAKEKAAKDAANSQKQNQQKAKQQTQKTAEKPPKKDTSQTDLATICTAIIALINEKSDDDGFLQVGEIGNILAKRYADFDVRNFGFSKMVPFLESLDLFTINMVSNPEDKKNPKSKIAYIKLKE